MTLYEEIKAAGIETDSHESDLYVLATAEAFVILRKHKPVNFTRFVGNDGRNWLDVPFMYSPWWEHKSHRA
jgi:hypothetical protein